MNEGRKLSTLRALREYCAGGAANGDGLSGAIDRLAWYAWDERLAKQFDRLFAVEFADLPERTASKVIEGPASTMVYGALGFGAKFGFALAVTKPDSDDPASVDRWLEAAWNAAGIDSWARSQLADDDDDEVDYHPHMDGDA